MGSLELKSKPFPKTGNPESTSRDGALRGVRETSVRFSGSRSPIAAAVIPGTSEANGAIDDDQLWHVSEGLSKLETPLNLPNKLPKSPTCKHYPDNSGLPLKEPKKYWLPFQSRTTSLERCLAGKTGRD